MNNIQVDIEFKTCKDCNIEKYLDDYYIMKNNYSASCKKCCIARNRENYLKSDKYTKKEKIAKIKVETKVRTKKGDVKKQLLLKEVTEFINKVERLRGYIDFVDAYRLVSLRVDCLGVKFYERVSVEDELILTYDELKKWQKDDKKD